MENQFKTLGALACFLGATTLMTGVQDGISLASYAYQQTDYAQSEVGRMLASYTYSYSTKACYNLETRKNDFSKTSYQCAQLNFVTDSTASESAGGNAAVGVIGGVCLLIIIIAIIACCCKRRKKTTTTVTKEKTVIQQPGYPMGPPMMGPGMMGPPMGGPGMMGPPMGQPGMMGPQMGQPGMIQQPMPYMQPQ